MHNCLAGILLHPAQCVRRKMQGNAAACGADTAAEQLSRSHSAFGAKQACLPCPPGPFLYADCCDAQGGSAADQWTQHQHTQEAAAVAMARGPGEACTPGRHCTHLCGQPGQLHRMCSKNHPDKGQGEQQQGQT